MSTFNRNIITSPDVAVLAGATNASEVPRTLGDNPPGGSQPPGGPAAPSADDYLTRILKYVPPEIVGAYLFLAGIVNDNVSIPRDHAHWLLGVLIGLLVITVAYDLRVLNIIRASQIVMSVLGFAVYVFAIGGWFATTTWYHEWYASVALPLFALTVAIVRLKPLPVG